MALDTEFVWESTYYPRPAVLQVAGPSGAVGLIDLATEVDWSPLVALWSDPAVTVILHDPVQDGTLIHRSTGVLPRTVFDTRLAAGFAGLAATLSLGDLLRETVGVDLPKTQSRTNWLKRPLTEAQLQYAIDDVLYLPRAREELLSRVRSFGNEAWLAEELLTLEDPALYAERSAEEQYLRMKAARRMDPRTLAVFRSLVAWREREARSEDRPRGWVIPDGALSFIAAKAFTTLDQLQGVRELDRRRVEYYGPGILEAVRAGLAAEPPERIGDAREGEDREMLAAAVAVIEGRALARGIDPGLVATRRELAEVQGAQSREALTGHRVLTGWRNELLDGDTWACLRAAGRGDACGSP